MKTQGKSHNSTILGIMESSEHKPITVRDPLASLAVELPSVVYQYLQRHINPVHAITSVLARRVRIGIRRQSNG